MNIRSKIAIAVVAVALVGLPFATPDALALTESQISSILNLLSSFGADQSTIDDVDSALRGQPTSGGTGTATECNFTRSLTMGSTGADVKCLQEYLNSAGFTVASSGVGSAGNETTYFGSLTRAAVIDWQNAYAADVLTPVGLSAGTGYWGSSSIAHYNAIAGTVTDGTGDTDDDTPTATGSGLSISTVSQPSSTLAPEGAARVPFTKFALTASSDGDVTVDSVTIEKAGLLNDSVFSGVIILDQDGDQIGIARTLNSNHRVILSSDFTVPAGQTKVYTIAGNMAASLDSYSGEVGGLDVIAIDAGSTSVNGSLPVTGTQHTMNSSLSIGGLTVEAGAFDPGSANSSLNVGTQGYTFAGLKFTAGSAEDIEIEAIRWNQAGSASIGDLENVVINIDGTDYSTDVDDDGDYYTASLANPITVSKGEVVQLYIKGDVESGSARTIDFNIYRKTDIVVKGKTYGYNITASGGSTGSASEGALSSNTQPFFNAYAHTISDGTIKVQKATSVSSQTVAENLSDQPLGGFAVEVKGESISVSQIVFDLATTPAASGVSIDSDDVTNITLEDENGNIVAGPVDGVAGGDSAVTFTDSVTFPIGTTVYTLKGKLGTDFSDNDTIAASTTPGDDWTSVKGDVTGNDITPTPATSVTGSTMTVKAASLRVSVSPTPSAQDMVAGTSGFHFADYVLDASSSGEDIRVTLMKPQLTISTAGTADDLSSCQLWDGDTAVNTGGNVYDPGNSVSSGDDVAFTFDSGFTIDKGTVKTLALKCNVRANTDGTAGTSTYAWGIEDATANVISSGMTSGQSVTEDITTSAGQNMTIQTEGSLSVALDTSSPALKWVQAGATDQTLAVFRVTSSYEDISLSQIGLQIATSSTANDSMASNTPSDLPKVTIWNGADQVGEAVFTTSDYATATLSGVVVPKDQQTLLTVRGDIGTMVGTTLNSKPGHLALVDYDASSGDNESNVGLEGVGQSSGGTVYAGGSDSSSNGARIAKAVPTLEVIPLTSSESKLANGSLKTLYKFKVTAPSGTNGISLYKFSFDIATSTGGGQELPGGGVASASAYRIDTLEVYCYDDDGFSNVACNAFDSSGRLNQGGLAFTDFDDTDDTTEQPSEVGIRFNPTDSTGGSTAEAIVIPDGQTRYFALKGTVRGSATTTTGISAEAKLLGDATFTSINNAALMNFSGKDLTAEGDSYSTGRYIFATTAVNVDAWDDDDFIWSGNSTNTAMSIHTYDWFNGFLVPGLPTTNAASAVLTP